MLNINRRGCVDIFFVQVDKKYREKKDFVVFMGLKKALGQGK